MQLESAVHGSYPAASFRAAALRSLGALRRARRRQRAAQASRRRGGRCRRTSGSSRPARARWMPPSSEVDYKTNTLVFTDVVISQGDMRVQADHAHATGLDFDNSRWTFEGNVRIDAEQRGSLRSDSAVVEFKDNHIARATVTGKPAEFEQKREDSEQIARGHADRDRLRRQRRAPCGSTDEAWLSDGQSEISGPLLVYNIRAQRVQATLATPGSDQRVHILHHMPDSARQPKWRRRQGAPPAVQPGRSPAGRRRS